MGRFNRFLHLERERAADAKPGSPTESDENARATRFDAVQTDEAGPQSTGSAAGHLARFEAQEPQRADAEHEKEVVDQPFLRCRKCEGDSHRRAKKCQHCLADLDTPEQRAFNEGHWKAVVAHREAQKEMLRATRKSVADDEARLKKALTDSRKGPLEKLIEERLKEDWRPRGVKLAGVHVPFRVLIAGAVIIVALVSTFAKRCG